MIKIILATLLLLTTSSIIAQNKEKSSPFLTEEQILQEFLDSKSTKKWSQKELNIQINRCGEKVKGKSQYCKRTFKIISKHINYDKFIGNTDYQQGYMVGLIMRAKVVKK